MKQGTVSANSVFRVGVWNSDYFKVETIYHLDLDISFLQSELISRALLGASRELRLVR